MDNRFLLSFPQLLAFETIFFVIFFFVLTQILMVAFLIKFDLEPLKSILFISFKSQTDCFV